MSPIDRNLIGLGLLAIAGIACEQCLPKKGTRHVTTEAFETIMYGKSFKFNPGNHSYYWDGQRLPSVTGIVGKLDKPGLLKWAAEEAIREVVKQGEKDEHGNVLIHSSALDGCAGAYEVARRKGAAKGKTTHTYAESRLRGEEAQPSPPGSDSHFTDIALDKWLAHADNHGFRPIEIERRICSAKHLYAGTLDQRAAYYNERAIIDFKTSSGIYGHEFWLQMTGYEIALTEETGEKIDALYIVRLDKLTGEFEEVRKPVSQIYRDAFLALNAFVQAEKRFKEVK